MRDTIDNHGKALRVGWCALVVIVFALVIAIRIRLWGFPLERDEGEYAYAGQLMLQGIPPSKLAYNNFFGLHGRTAPEIAQNCLEVPNEPGIGANPEMPFFGL